MSMRNGGPARSARRLPDPRPPNTRMMTGSAVSTPCVAASLLATALRDKGKVRPDLRSSIARQLQAVQFEVAVAGFEFISGSGVAVEQGAVRQFNVRHLQGGKRSFRFFRRLE